MICCAYDCVTPAAAPSSALRTSCTGAVRVRTRSRSKSRGMRRITPASPAQHRLVRHASSGRRRVRPVGSGPRRAAGRRGRATSRCGPSIHDVQSRASSPRTSPRSTAAAAGRSASDSICATMIRSRKICRNSLRSEKAERAHRQSSRSLEAARSPRRAAAAAIAGEHQRLAPEVAEPDALQHDARAR